MSNSKQPVKASAEELENVNITSTDHVVAIGDGTALSILTQVAGEELKIDTPEQLGFTITLPYAGWHHIAVTKVYKVGTTITGTITLVAW